MKHRTTELNVVIFVRPSISSPNYL